MDAENQRPLIAFVHIQKAAGTSLKFILKNSLGVGHSDVNPVTPPFDRPFDRSDLAFAASTNPWLCSISGHEIIEPSRHLGKAARPFTMLRDPIARSVSHYQDKIVRGRQDLSFEQFVSDPDNHNFQVKKIAGREDLATARQLLREQFFFVGLAERFVDSMRVLRALSPYPLDIRCRPRNVAPTTRIAESLRSDPEAVARLGEANRLDQKLWDFVADELFPELAQRAGVSETGPLPALSPAAFPWRYHASRLYHRLVYRPLLKRERRRRGVQA